MFTVSTAWRLGSFLVEGVLFSFHQQDFQTVDIVACSTTGTKKELKRPGTNIKILGYNIPCSSSLPLPPFVLLFICRFPSPINRLPNMILNARHIQFRLLPPRKYDVTYLFIFLSVLLYKSFKFLDYNPTTFLHHHICCCWIKTV